MSLLCYMCIYVYIVCICVLCVVLSVELEGAICTDCENKFPPLRTIKNESESES